MYKSQGVQRFISIVMQRGASSTRRTDFRIERIVDGHNNVQTAIQVHGWACV